MMMKNINKDLGIVFLFSDDDTPLVGSKTEKFKTLETALKLKLKHLYTRERVIIVLFKGNNQLLFNQMLKLRPWINPQKGVFQHSGGSYIKTFSGGKPLDPHWPSGISMKNYLMKGCPGFDWTSTFMSTNPVQFFMGLLLPSLPVIHSL